MRYFLIISMILLASCAAHAPLNAPPRVATSPAIAEPPEPAAPEFDLASPPGTIEVVFASRGERLNGFLYTVGGDEARPTVVLLHGYPGNEKNLDVAQDLRRAGFNVFFFHYRGAWGSGGEFGFRHVIEDVASALAMLRDRADTYKVDTRKLLLVGHSMGGFAALHGAANDTSVICVAGLAAWDVGETARLFATDASLLSMWRDYSDSLAMLAGWDGAKAVREMTANMDTFSLRLLAPRLPGRSVLLIAADRDAAVPANVFHEPMVAAFRENSAIDLEHMVLSGDHSWSWNRETLSQLVVRWADQCVN